MDKATDARIMEIIGDNRCGCGKKADRFRLKAKAGLSYYCHPCYVKIVAEDDLDVTIVEHRIDCSHHLIDDPDNMPDLFWAPPRHHRRNNFAKSS